jgi:peroxiredoxin
VEIAVLVVRLFLAGVFAVAGAAKLADRRGSRAAAVDFGVPRAFAGVAALGLPLAELAVAAALLPAGSAVWGLAGACALLVAFTAAIALSMARGQAPDCHCFGQLHSEPAGPRTLIRNAVLLALAGGATFGAAFGNRGASAVAWLGELSARDAVLVAAGAVPAALATAVFIARAQRRPAARPLPDLREMGLPEGFDAPDFALPDRNGTTVSLAELLRRGAPVVLAFTDTECASCRELLPMMAGWQRNHEGAVTIAIVNAGPPDGTRELAEEHGLRDILFDLDREVHKAYEVTKTPAGVRVDQPAMIATPYAARVKGIEALVETVVTGREPVFGLLPGEPLPADVFLEAEQGRRVPLADLAGEETLFLFWDPDCGSCREIREHLLDWEEHPRLGTPRLVVVTSSERKAVRAEGFDSPILFDPDRVAAGALGVTGTPMAVLVDAEGRIAWPLAAGPGYILRLIHSRVRVAA